MQPAAPGRPRTDDATPHAIAREYALGDITFDQIAGRMGVTRDRVRRWVVDADPEALLSARAMRRAMRREATALEHERDEARALVLGYRCRVCQGPNLRGLRSGFFVTCSERCGRLWPLARYHLDGEYRARHRESVARWALAHPESCPPQRLRSAERSLSGVATFRGRWTVAGSHVERALAQVRALREDVARRWGPPPPIDEHPEHDAGVAPSALSG